MHSVTGGGRRLLTVALAAVSLAGCAAAPFDYRSSNEIPEGPGLLSGTAGAFVYRSEAPAGGRSADAATASAEAVPSTSDELAEFEAFQAFRRAKAARSDEYREFRDWVEWRSLRSRRSAPATAR